MPAPSEAGLTPDYPDGDHSLPKRDIKELSNDYTNLTVS